MPLITGFYEVKSNDAVGVKELEFFASDDELNTHGGVEKLKLDDKYVGGYKLNSDTVVFDGADGWANSAYNPKAKDLKVTTWGELQGKGFDITEATYYFNEDEEIEYLVIEKSDAANTTKYNAVLYKSIARYIR